MRQFSSQVLFDHDVALCSKRDRLAGLDEVGRGCLAGPVVAACIVFPQSHRPLAGVNDSKKMSALRREKAYKILRTEALAVGIGWIHADVIDKVNILNATYMAMAQALKKIESVIDEVWVDGRSVDGLQDFSLRKKAFVGGDARSYIIASASIIAKVFRDRYMKRCARRYPEYGFEKHKGYGTRYHLERISERGVSPLHRITFKPLNKG